MVEGGQRLAGVGRRLTAREAGLEVGDEDVVGLERLKAARVEAAAVLGGEDDARRGEADGAVARRRLALGLGGRAGGLPGLLAVGLVGGLDLGIAERGDDAVGVETGHRGQLGTEIVVVVEQPRSAEPAELQRAHGGPLVLGLAQAGGDDGAAGPARGRDARPGRRPAGMPKRRPKVRYPVACRAGP